ncbi:MAG TPA: RDD family protein, partial [Acidimicrobiales bacterium]
MVQPIITPEAVVLDYERAGVASRTLAMTVDGLALLAVWLLLAFGAAWLLDASDGAGSAVIYVLASLALVFAWFCGFEVLWQGRTPGKAALGLRVVTTDGTPLRFQHSFLRAAVGIIDFLLIPIGVIAVVAVLLSPRDQRVGDMAAGTFVVRERSARSHVAPAWFPAPPGHESYAASLDVGALGEDGYALVRAYLLRTHELAANARDHLAVRLANGVALRLDHRPPRWVHPHAFLLCVASAWQRAHGMVPRPWGLADSDTPWAPPPAPPAPAAPPG